MSENSQPISTVLISRPGIMQQSLRSSLAACPHIAVVAISGDGLTALKQIMQHQPRLLVIDSNLLDEEVESLLAVARSEQPPICCLVYVSSAHQETAIQATGVDIVAHRNWSTQDLHSALGKLAQSLG